MKVFKNILKALFIVAGLLAMFAPYEYEKEENGDFTYKAWLLGIRRKTEEEKKHYRISFFTKPKIKRAKHVLPDLDVDDDYATSADVDSDDLSDLADDISDKLAGLE
ncbi:MAG: hypothetical protein IKZ81_07220 [Clostridia bacterium]|nr:hypothetical protein [Clostridia bacterium]MBR5943117.1 hypothetical protein [Clostridia bacterium]